MEDCYRGVRHSARTIDGSSG